jgi:hypothetical protein
MKNRTYDRIVYAVLGTALIGMSALLYQGCSSELENPAPKVGIKNINHATSVYEVEFDGQKYIVVQTFKGIGVCKK